MATQPFFSDSFLSDLRFPKFQESQKAKDTLPI